MKCLLSLYPDTFLWLGRSVGVVYDSRFGALARFPSAGKAGALARRLSEPLNLYSVPLDPDSLSEDEARFTKMITEGGFGAVTAADDPPFTYPPLLNLQYDYDGLRTDPQAVSSAPVLEYLTSVTFYTGGAAVPHDYWRQTFYPRPSADCLPAVRIKEFLGRALSSNLANIGVVFSSPADYPDFDELTDCLCGLGREVVYYFYCGALAPDGVSIEKTADRGIAVRVVCDFDRPDVPEALLGSVRTAGVGWNFIVRSAGEYERAEELTLRYGLTDVRMLPVYDCNEEFFRSAVFIDEDDLSAGKPSKREVFAHQALNTHFFGRFFVWPDGSVSPSPDAAPVGTLDDDVYELVIREMDGNAAWRRLRGGGPCAECLYRWLCPSPSAYETALGRPNLCSVSPPV